jgi:hypothetical protein
MQDKFKVKTAPYIPTAEAGGFTAHFDNIQIKATKGQVWATRFDIWWLFLQRFVAV